jgi:hypothetical protein
MKMAARELLRRPRSFAVPAGILVLLALLLLYPSAILDGLNDNTTGALRTAPADLIVYAENAKASLLRSRIDGWTRQKVEAVDGIEQVSSFDVMLLSGYAPGGSKPIGLAVLTSETPLGPKVPERGQAYVDSSLKETAGLKEGDEVLIGPFSTPVEVIGFTHDTNLFFQSGMIVSRDTWRESIGLALPAAPPDGAEGTTPEGTIPEGTIPEATDPIEGVTPSSLPEGPSGPSGPSLAPGSGGTSTTLAMEPVSFTQEPPSPTLPPGPGPSGPPTSFPPVTGDPFGGSSPITVPSTTTSSATTSTTTTTTAPAPTTGSTVATTPSPTTVPGEAVPPAGPAPAAEEGPDPADASQTLFLTLKPGADPVAVAAAVDEATSGKTATITPQEAVRSLPGMSQQSTTFGYIRMVTLGVALVVVGLFLSFVTLERTPLYAVLKALGMSSRQLFTGVVIQVLLVTITAALVATVATWGLTHVPLELPTTMRPVRFIETVAALGVTSVVGSVLSLRRVVRVDPASAIG